MLAPGRVLRSAIGYTLVAAVCFDPDLSRTLDLHGSPLPLLFFVVFDAARPLADLVQQSLLAVAGALLGLLLSSLCVLIGSRTLDLIGFVVYNFLFAFARPSPSLFVAYLCASICTQVVLVVPAVPTFAHGVRFVRQLCTSCALIIAATAVTWPPTSAAVLRDRLARSFESIADAIAAIRAGDGSAVAAALALSASLPALLRSASIEPRYNRMPISVCRGLARAVHETASHLQAISAADVVVLRQAAIGDTLAALQAVSSDIAANMTTTNHVPDDDHVARLRSALDVLQSADLRTPQIALPSLVLSFRLKAMAVAVVDADDALRRLPRRRRLHLPTLSRSAPRYATMTSRRSSSVVFAAKVALALGLLASTAFVQRAFFSRWVTTWAMITAGVVLTPTLGAVQTAITFRAVGTVTGAVSAALIAALCRNRAVLALALFAVSAPAYGVRFGARKLYRSLAVTWQLMFTAVIVTTIARDDPIAVPVEIAAQTALALVVCWTLMIAVAPTSLARDRLRERIANQLIWFGVLFDHLSKRVVVVEDDDVDDDLGALERHLRWQQTVTIADLLEQAAAEPNPFGARFRRDQWRRLVEATTSLLESIELGHAAIRYRRADDDDLGGVQLPPAPLINEFFVLAAALHAGIALPPMPLVERTRAPGQYDGNDEEDEAEDGADSDPVWKAAFDLSAQDTVRLLAEVERILRTIVGELSFKLPRHAQGRRTLDGLRIGL